MNAALRAAVRTVRFFGDDWRSAVAVVLWIGVVALVRARLPQAIAGAVLFLGIALVLIVSVRTEARD
jgi:hypothetical protein